jgi:hypothetical protein
MAENFEGPNAEETNETEKVRAAIHEEAEKKIKERLERNPMPTDEEVMIGAYLDELEPQVRDAILEFYKKGYQTESSGFYEVGDRRVQAIDGYFEIDEPTEKKLNALGAKVERTETYDGTIQTKIYFEPESPDLTAITAKWHEIADVLPDLGKPAYAQGGSEHWLDRNDIQKYFIQRRYNMGAFKPEEKELVEKRLKELGGE